MAAPSRAAVPRRAAAPRAVGRRSRLPAAGDRAAAQPPARLGCATLDGGGMAVFQAADAFRLFTGREPDAARMLADIAELADAGRHERVAGAAGRDRDVASDREGARHAYVHRHRVPQRLPRPRSSPPPPGPASTASRSSRTTCSPARSRPRRSAPARADLGLSIDLYQPMRDIEAVPAEEFARNLRRAEHKFELMARLGADTVLVCSSVSPLAVDDDALAAEQLRRLADLAEELRHPGRLRGARLGPARQHVRPRLAHRRGGRPPGARHLPGQLPHPRPRLAIPRASRTSPARRSSSSSSPTPR